MISLQKIIKAMETQLKTPEKRGEIVDLQISPPEIPPKKRGEIEDLQMSSPEIQIEDLSEEKLFLRKKIIQVTQVIIKKKPTNQLINQLNNQLTGQAGNPPTLQKKKPAEKPGEKSV